MVRVTRLSGWFFLIFLLASSVSGCASRSVNLNIHASDLLNQDEYGESYSVLLHVYQLRSLNEIEEVGYEGLINAPESSLARSLLDFQELLVEPGNSYVIELNPEKDARFYAIAAFFRGYDSEDWKMQYGFKRSLLFFFRERRDVYLSGHGID